MASFTWNHTCNQLHLSRSSLVYMVYT
ncbi:hypothetical protein F383_38488 [Gossypium arboreum]|uniref:Uncharacterized protein n=1 Tax=Gossypium arboreum TaxID=29729 RepID=A0A0B0MJ19_GOSAR|nr:hypothetical protein F383_38488 [Gossypium arboreum]